MFKFKYLKLLTISFFSIIGVANSQNQINCTVAGESPDTTGNPCCSPLIQDGNTRLCVDIGFGPTTDLTTTTVTATDTIVTTTVISSSSSSSSSSLSSSTATTTSSSTSSSSSSIPTSSTSSSIATSTSTPAFSTTSTSSANTITTTATPVSSTSASSTTGQSVTSTSGNSVSSNSSLSTGAIAGIAIGGAAVGLLALLLGVFLCFKYRNRRTAVNESELASKVENWREELNYQNENYINDEQNNYIDHNGLYLDSKVPISADARNMVGPPPPPPERKYSTGSIDEPRYFN